MERSVLTTKLYLGVMSKNIVDGVISFVKKNGVSIGLIASRRQIDYNNSYVNGWTTKTFVRYVKKYNKDIIVCRDHGGIGQGSLDDNGIISLIEDSQYMDIIHIDPWKNLNFTDSVDYTICMIKNCSLINKSCRFEIGTEESIFPMTPNQLDELIKTVKTKIPRLFDKIIYVVIQSGTSLLDGINTGNYKKEKLLDMLEVSSRYGLLAKEHNGDYLLPNQIRDKLNLGLSAINVAPEVAHIETDYILNHISVQKFNDWFDLCLRNAPWKKWFSKDFNPELNRYEIVRLCGHYVFSHVEFCNIFNLATVSSDVSKKIHHFLEERSYR